MSRAVVIGAVVAAAGVAALCEAFGPGLLAANCLESALDRVSADYQANGGSWPQLQDTCTICTAGEASPRTRSTHPLPAYPRRTSRLS